MPESVLKIVEEALERSSDKGDGINFVFFNVVDEDHFRAITAVMMFLCITNVTYEKHGEHGKTLDPFIQQYFKDEMPSGINYQPEKRKLDIQLPAETVVDAIKSLRIMREYFFADEHAVIERKFENQSFKVYELECGANDGYTYGDDIIMSFFCETITALANYYGYPDSTAVQDEPGEDFLLYIKKEAFDAIVQGEVYQGKARA